MAKLTPVQIVDIETQAFLDSQFAPLDLTGCPSCLPPPSEDAELPDPRFAPLDDRGVGLGAAALKRGLEELVYDPEVQQQLARETGDPEILAELQQHRAEQVAREFRRTNPRYYRSQENWEALVQCLAFNCLGWESDECTVEEAQDALIHGGHWTLDNLTAAFRELSRVGALETDPYDPRPLSEHQRRSIALQAGTGDVEAAITRYLQLRLPRDIGDRLVETFGLDDLFDQLADPQFKSVIEEAVWFCWQYARPNYAPTRQRKQFMQAYIAGRIPTATLLDEAWKACQEAEKDATRSAVLGQINQPEQISAPDLDSLSDQEVESLYHRTLRQVTGVA